MQDDTRWGEKRRREELARWFEERGLPVPWELRPGRRRSKLTIQQLYERRPLPIWLWRDGKHLYCRDEEWYGRGLRMKPSVEVEGRVYYSVATLSGMQRVAEWPVYRWAKLHPEETIVFDGHTHLSGEHHERYRKTKGWIDRDGHRYYSVRDLARRRKVTDQAAANWAKRHPEFMIRVGRYIYARDEPYIRTGPTRKRTPPPEIVLKTIAARRNRRGQ